MLPSCLISPLRDTAVASGVVLIPLDSRSPFPRFYQILRTLLQIIETHQCCHLLIVKQPHCSHKLFCGKLMRRQNSHLQPVIWHLHQWFIDCHSSIFVNTQDISYLLTTSTTSSNGKKEVHIQRCKEVLREASTVVGLRGIVSDSWFQLLNSICKYHQDLFMAFCGFVTNVVMAFCRLIARLPFVSTV